jgi:cobalamin biosynthesis Mg chelatase CobN
MKAFIMSLALFGFVAVAPAFAGGGFDPYQQGYKPGASVSGVPGNQANSALGSDSALGASSSTIQSADASSTNQNSGNSHALLWQIALVVLIVAVATGLLIWSFRGNKI